MTECPGDLRQGDPGVGHLAGHRVPEPVGAHHRHARPETGRPDDAGDPIGSEGPSGATARRNTSRCPVVFGRPLRS
jgi:hypothetical protein